jgi:hypothetical protein
MNEQAPEQAMTSAMMADLLTNPAVLCSRPEVMSSPSVVPATRGLYGWWFRKVPPDVPCDDCARLGDLTLLYVGISPKNPASTQHLRRRILTHYAGNAEGSTLRRTLGVLLAETSGFPLRRVGSGKRMTFTHLGEQWLDAWLDANALVGCVEHPEPWTVEAEVFSRLSLPLNLKDNQHHAFHAVLSARRAAAKAWALGEPVAQEDNQRRRI